MKLLHSADWHLGAPLTGRADLLRDSLASLPEKICALARAERCDLMLLSGDLFDSTCNTDLLRSVSRTLGASRMPVCIAPGNHDPAGANSLWQQISWPENVHIFQSGNVESISIPSLDCRVYGAGFQDAHCPALLQDFRADCTERYAVGVFHGDPTQADSLYNPITLGQVRESGLDYLALGHIHKQGAFSSGSTLCAWPGCAMGRGFDETGEKGVLIVTLDGTCQARFLPLDVPRFHWLTAQVEGDALAALQAILPASGSRDCFRVDLTGTAASVDTQALLAMLPQFPNLELRDQTLPPLDVWETAGTDTLEGVYFQLLREAGADPDITALAARISRQILLGQEVVLP